MNYCSNCGEKSSKKICEHCGVKKNTTHHFCEWCGNPLNENATLCTKCHERIRPSGISKFSGIICILGIIVFIFAAILALSLNAILSTVIFIIGLVLLMPFIKQLIKKVTHEKQWLRSIINTARVFLVFALFVVGIMVTPDSNSNITYEIYTNEATKAAEVVFHEEVALKNESSFVLNDSKVTYLTEPYNGHENLRLVFVEIDYSAQNGFGGMNRESYTVEILFNYENGEYYRLDGSHINTYK